MIYFVIKKSELSFSHGEYRVVAEGTKVDMGLVSGLKYLNGYVQTVSDITRLLKYVI